MRILSNMRDSTVRGIISICEKISELELTIFDNTVTVFDVFDQVKPHLFITKNSLLDRAILKYLLLYPNVKTCIIQTKERNFYGRELEKKGRVDYTIPDEPAADLVSFSKLSRQSMGDFFPPVVVTELINDEDFKHVQQNPDRYIIYGGKFVEHPSYVGTVTFEDLFDLYENTYNHILCSEETDQEFSLLHTNKVCYARGVREKFPPTPEDIKTKYNYSVKLSNILKNTGFEEESKLCLATLQDL